jgi:hypothetical protein
MPEIYGVDTEKMVTPTAVRDAIIRCFVVAHKEILDDMKDFGDFRSEKEFMEMKELNVELMIKKLFDDVGGDFDKPTKESLIKVCDKLAEFSKNFRKPEIIRKHYGEIMQLIKHLD